MHVSVKMRIEGTALISLSEGFTRFRLVEIQFSSLEQAIAVRDVIEPESKEFRGTSRCYPNSKSMKFSSWLRFTDESNIDRDTGTGIAS